MAKSRAKQQVARRELPSVPGGEAVDPLMPTTVQYIYEQVTKIFLEDVGFSAGTGMITDSMFFTALGDVMDDFLDRTGCIKKIVNIPIAFGESTYTEPDFISEVQSASQNQTFIYRDSGFFLDQRLTRIGHRSSTNQRSGVKTRILQEPYNSPRHQM